MLMNLVSSRIVKIDNITVNNGDRVPALTISSVYPLYTPSVSENIEILLAHIETKFEGLHFGYIISMVFLVYLSNSMKQAYVDIRETVDTLFFRKL